MQAFASIGAPWQSALVARGGLTCLLVGMSAAAIGCWVMLRDLPYAAESLSHGMFPGLVAASIIGISPIIGGLAGLAIAATLIWLARRSGLGGDIAVAVVVGPLLGLGALLALSRKVPVGIESILFGDLLGADDADIALAAALGALSLSCLRTAHWRLVGAGVLGRQPAWLDLMVICLLALATVAAARSLGALLAVALILGPPAAARRLSSRAGPMIVTACAISALATVAGIEISWFADIATGPAVAICAIIPAAVVSLPLPHRRPNATR